MPLKNHTYLILHLFFKIESIPKSLFAPKSPKGDFAEFNDFQLVPL